MPVTPHGRRQRRSGGVATKPEARRIATNIAKLPEHVTKRQTQTEQGPPAKLGLAIKRTPRSLHVRGVPELLLQLRLLSWAAGCRGIRKRQETPQISQFEYRPTSANVSCGPHKGKPDQ